MRNQYSDGSHRVARACEQCSSAFDVSASKVAAGSGKFCSRTCQGAARRDRAERICEACGTTFTAKGGRVRAGLAKFCSSTCSNRTVGAARAEPLLVRLWSRINKHGPVPDYRPDLGPCWIWTGQVESKGYGRIVLSGHQGKTASVHRMVYEILVGPIPHGLELDHLCRVHRCCNPSHLEPVTTAENQRRGVIARLAATS